MNGYMKFLPLVMVGPVLALVSSCATTQQPTISVMQAQSFDDIVRRAEAAGANEYPQEAARLLREAKSDFFYAEHLPSDPVRAREMARRAQDEAERALTLAQSNPVRKVALHTPLDQLPPVGAPTPGPEAGAVIVPASEPVATEPEAEPIGN